MDGNRRHEVVTSCDHLQQSHTSYSDQTQMLRHETRARMRRVGHVTKVFSAAVHGVSNGFVSCQFLIQVNSCRSPSTACLFQRASCQSLLIQLHPSFPTWDLPVWTHSTSVFVTFPLSWSEPLILSSLQAICCRSLHPNLSEGQRNSEALAQQWNYSVDNALL